jgi:predicted HicB family RNase H-like nuclease
MVRQMCGEVLGQSDVKPFEGRFPEESEESVRQSVDLYLEMCANDGVMLSRKSIGTMWLEKA